MPDPLPWWRIAAPVAVFALLVLAGGVRRLPLLRIILLACLR